MNYTEKDQLNTLPETEENGAAGSIYIEDGDDILKERLELCMLRSASFDPSKADPDWAGFLRQCLEVLGNKCAAISNGEKLCKLNTSMHDDTLCKPIQSFWLTELSLLPTELSALVPAWETTLQILLEVECAKAEGIPVSEKEIRDILYSYFYDYAEEMIGETGEAADSSQRFLTAFLSGKETEHVRAGLSLFFGDRLKARLLDLLEKKPELRRKISAEASAGGTFPRAEGTSLLLSLRTVHRTVLDMQGKNRPSCRGNVPPAETAEPAELTAHQGKALAEFWKKAATLLALSLMALALTACGGKEEDAENTTEIVTEDEDAYPGTVAYEDSENDIEDRFGIMHATVLDVQNGEKDGLFIYTLRDKEDPDNAWCLNSQDVGSIVCNVTSGKEVAVLFSGDIVNDPDNVEFIAILDDAPYTIKQVEGTTISNMMNSFTVRTTKGVELNFIKDNCKVDRDALSTDNSTRILIFYTDGGSADHYPLRVYKLPQKER